MLKSTATPEQFVTLCQKDPRRYIPMARKAAHKELEKSAKRVRELAERGEVGEYSSPIADAFAKAGRTDLSIFSLFFFPHRIRRSTPFFHHEIYESYKAGHGDDNILALLPRGTGKSEVCSFVIPVHGICYYDAESWQQEDLRNAWGHRFIVIVSESGKMAEKLLRGLKAELVPNDYNELFLYAFTGDPKGTFRGSGSWSTYEIVTDNGVMIASIGSNAQIRGVKNWFMRPSLIVVDDPEGNKKVTRSDMIEKTREWFYEEAWEARDKDGEYAGKILVVGTVVDEWCLVNYLRHRDASFKVIYHEVLEDGKSIWEERKPTKKVLKERKEAEAKGRLASWMQENMHRARSKGEKAFQPDDFKYWDGEYVWSPELGTGFLDLKNCFDARGNAIPRFANVKIPITTTAGIDLASSDKASADFTVVQAIGTDADGNTFLLDYYRKRVTTPTPQAQAVFDLHARYHFDRVVVETVAYQGSFAGLLREEMVRRNIYFTLIPEPHRAQIDKETRIQNTLEPHFTRTANYNGIILFDKSNHAIVYQECNDFPSKGTHDDIVDALSMAKKYARICPYRDLPSLDIINRQDEEESLQGVEKVSILASV